MYDMPGMSADSNTQNQRTQIQQVTWAQAKQECQSRGMDLCTGEQLSTIKEVRNFSLFWTILFLVLIDP